MRWPPPPNWPMAQVSRQVLSRPHRWHIQEAGTGPTLLLLHGAGGATQSFRGLFPALAQRHHVVAIDLPGQGFTRLGARHRCGLLPTAEDLDALCAQQGWSPQALVGHSAGGALALRLSQIMAQRTGHWPRVVGINAALAQFEGLAGLLFPAMAKMLALTPFASDMFARSGGSPDRVRGLIESTGSQIDDTGLALYAQLVADRDHVDATLLMMAQWALHPLQADFRRIEAQTLFLTGLLDKAVPPGTADQAQNAMPHAQEQTLPNLGHLAHEEAPDEIAERIAAFVTDVPRKTKTAAGKPRPSAA